MQRCALIWLARLSAWRKTTATVFAFLHALTSREHSHYPYPSPAEDERARIQVALPFALTEATNDGVVPTLSQIYGEPLLAVVADHLDVVGQFMDAGGTHYSVVPCLNDSEPAIDLLETLVRQSSDGDLTFT